MTSGFKQLTPNVEYDIKLDASEDNLLDSFLASVRFFPTPRILATRILQLNQALGDSFIQEEIESLSSGSPPLSEDENFEKSAGWVNSVIAKVSSILFHDEHAQPEQTSLSGEELISFFQKVVSERIYDHLSFLALSPHAKQGRSFSLEEELTEGIAEDIGLGLYRQSDTPAHLSQQSKEVLLDLAREFQRWLVEERGGCYTAGWGEIFAQGFAPQELDASKNEPATKKLVVWLEPDVQAREAGRRPQVETVAAAL
ncbi:MAG TPA: hypothetical protein VJU84_06810 [Pyrinomonadaceae bacterium]|nr:hypothetical protein [Pyrinomonadaceae bacterium]